MKTEEDLRQIADQLRSMQEREYGSPEHPKQDADSARWLADHELWKRLHFNEPDDPSWSEAGLLGALNEVLQQDFEFARTMRACPSCGKDGCLKNYVDTIPFLERLTLAARRSWDLFMPLGNPEQGLRNFARLGREVVGAVSGNPERTSVLLLCTVCKRYCLKCPFCSRPNLLGGRTAQCESTTCGVCNTKYTAILFPE